MRIKEAIGWRSIGVATVVLAMLVVMVVLTASFASAQEEEQPPEATTSGAKAHPAICHAHAGEAEAFAC